VAVAAVEEKNQHLSEAMSAARHISITMEQISAGFIDHGNGEM
jgi:hypothetical protein